VKCFFGQNSAIWHNFSISFVLLPETWGAHVYLHRH